MSDEGEESRQNHKQGPGAQMSLSDGEEPASAEPINFDSVLFNSSSPKLQRKKVIRIKKSRNLDSTRSLTDPNLKAFLTLNNENSNNSDSTLSISDWTPNLPPTGLSRCRSPKLSRMLKSPMNEQNPLAGPEVAPSLTGNYVKANGSQKLRKKVAIKYGSSSASCSPSSSPMAFSVFKSQENPLKAGGPKEPTSAEEEKVFSSAKSEIKKQAFSKGADRSKLRLFSASSCIDGQSDGGHSSLSQSSSLQSANTKPPSDVVKLFMKTKSFKDCKASSPDPNSKGKHFFGSKYATISSKKHQALLRKYSLPSEYFTLNFNPDEPGELVASPPGQTLEQAIQTVVTKRGLTMDLIEVYLDSSKTPLPMNSDTFLLANSILWVKVLENRARKTSASYSISAEPRKRQSSLTRFKKLISSMEDVRVIDPGESQKSKVGSKGRLHSLFGSFSKPHADKQELLTEILASYGRDGLPKMPDLLTLGRPNYENEAFTLEQHWTDLVSDHVGLSKHEKDQQEALWEMLVTEVEYIGKLRVITDLFVCCLINLQNDLFLNEIEVDKLCSNIVDVYYATCHFWVVFMSQVVRRSRETGKSLDPSLLKPGFLLFDKMFEPYKKYCLEQEVCRDYIKNRLKDNELFRIFINWAESQPQCKRLKLTDLIVSPFQRLTKYKLLLYAVQRPINRHLKATSFPNGCLNGDQENTQISDGDQTWHGCYEQKQDIDIMVEQVGKFVNQVNVAMRMSQDHQQLSQIVEKIEAYDVVEAPNEECAKLIQKLSQFDLTMPIHGCGQNEPRSLVMEGVLKMKDSCGKCDVQCYLFTDMFLITKMTFKKVDKVKYKVIKAPMRLDKIVVQELKDGASFVIVHLNEFHLAQNATHLLGDSRPWVEAITKAQGEYKNKRWTHSRRSDLSQLFDSNEEFGYAGNEVFLRNSGKFQRSTSASDSTMAGFTSSSLFSLDPPFSVFDQTDDGDSLLSSFIGLTSGGPLDPFQEHYCKLDNRTPTGSNSNIAHDSLRRHGSPVTKDTECLSNFDATMNTALSRDRRSKSSDDALLAPPITSADSTDQLMIGYRRQRYQDYNDADDSDGLCSKSLSCSLPNYLDRDAADDKECGEVTDSSYTLFNDADHIDGGDRGARSSRSEFYVSGDDDDGGGVFSGSFRNKDSNIM